MKLEVHNLTVLYPGVKALSNVDFTVETGDIKALVGANGAGKSTLIKVLSGALSNYQGELYCDGKKLDNYQVNQAKSLGIETVYQEVDEVLFPSVSVAENILIKEISDKKSKPFINFKKLYLKAETILKSLDIDLDVKELVDNLTLAQKQMVLIARALASSCKLLILDEPTAPLSSLETNKLFEIIRKLRDTKKLAIIFISHRLMEIKQICNKITILKNGEVVEDGELLKDRSIDSIVEVMLGRNPKLKNLEIHNASKETLFEVVDLEDVYGKINKVSFKVFKGEVLGITGLVGAGKTELSKTIFGETPKRSGKLYLNSEEIKIKNPTDAIKAGLALVPEERRKEGVLTSETVSFNLSAANAKTYSSGPWLNKKKELDNANYYIKKLGIKTPSPKEMVALLSGGNQQKVAVGKWLAANAKVYILDEPTKGIDIGAKEDIFKLIKRITEAGASVIYLTNDVEEILAFTNRCYVMYQGKLIKMHETSKTNEKELIFEMTGGVKDE